MTGLVKSSDKFINSIIRHNTGKKKNQLSNKQIKNLESSVHKDFSKKISEYPSAAKKKLISVTQKGEGQTTRRILGAGMLKEIKRKMMKHLPGRTKKTY